MACFIFHAQNSTSDMKLMLIGNKVDNKTKRQVTTLQGQQVHVHHLHTEQHCFIACQRLQYAVYWNECIIFGECFRGKLALMYHTSVIMSILQAFTSLTEHILKHVSWVYIAVTYVTLIYSHMGSSSYWLCSTIVFLTILFTEFC